MLFNEAATFPLALTIREPGGAQLGDVFAFLSGLYFRGKLAYALRFAAPPRGVHGTHIITPSRGLLTPDVRIGIPDLEEFAQVDVNLDEPRYRVPFERDARALASKLSKNTQIVLLGSVATDKYVRVLLDVFGPRICFPADFVGRGDMSRGGLLLRCVDAGEELGYIGVEGAIRRGSRPPKLEPRS